LEYTRHALSVWNSAEKLGEVAALFGKWSPIPNGNRIISNSVKS